VWSNPTYAMSQVNADPVLSDPPKFTNVMVEHLPFIEQDNLQARWNFTNLAANRGPDGSTSSQVVNIFICPTSPIATQPKATVSGNVYGLNSYGGVAGRNSFRAFNGSAFQITRDGMFYINSRVRFGGIIDGSSNTAMWGERLHRDRNFDRMYTNFPIIGWSGWAWVDQPNAVGDYLVGATQPINWLIPDTATGPNSSSNPWVQQRLSTMGSGHPGGANVCFADGSVRFLTASLPLPTLQALVTRAGGEVVTLP
jgi:prepilin-type processing-associated H-X9-DG protein